MRMPLDAPLPMPAMIAVGVARPRAQGQAITRVETIARRPITTPSDGAKTAQRMNVRRDIPTITGTKTAATLSTVFSTGALLASAPRTRRIIDDRTVASFSLRTLTLRMPLPLTVPAKTSVPFSLRTGSDSPVRRVSSTSEKPPVTMPSTVILSPGWMTTMSPGLTCSIGISISSTTGIPFSTVTLRSRTVLGCSPIRPLTAAAVPCLALSSR